MLTNWTELYPHHGTCPICGTGKLRLEDDLWIPPHDGTPGRAIGRLRQLAPQCRAEKPTDCPIGWHTQAVEDGGVEVELQWLELLLDALLRQEREARGEAATRDPSPAFAETMKLHTDACRALHRRWSRPNAQDDKLSKGIVCWRDREPVQVQTLDRDIRKQFAAEVDDLQHRQPPWEENVAQLWHMLREGVHLVTDYGDSSRVGQLRNSGWVRRVERDDKSHCHLTPLGHYVVGQFGRGHSAVAAAINTFRFTHRNFDPALRTA